MKLNFLQQQQIKTESPENTIESLAVEKWLKI